MELPLYIVLILYLYTPVGCYTELYTEYNVESIKKKDSIPKKWITSPTLNVGKERSSALIFKQVYNSSWTKSIDIEFKVKATITANGLFAVIQKMSLRQKPDKGDCIDFVQFLHSTESPLLKISGYPWNSAQKYCGELGKLHEPTSDKPVLGNIAPNAFKDDSGGIITRVHFSYPGPMIHDHMIEVEIAFTSFKSCTTGDSGSYKHCGNKTCIYKEYFNDNIVNCPYPNCVDESGCAVTNIADGVDSGFPLNTRVTVTATTSIFLSFFLFLGCIWLCRYFDMLCWIERVVGGGGGGESRRDSRNMEMSSVEPVPVPAPPSPDKDLPPAYETLFPDR